MDELRRAAQAIVDDDKARNRGYLKADLYVALSDALAARSEPDWERLYVEESERYTTLSNQVAASRSEPGAWPEIAPVCVGVGCQVLSPVARSEPGAVGSVNASDLQYGYVTTDYQRGYNDGIDVALRTVAATPAADSRWAKDAGVRRFEGVHIPPEWDNDAATPAADSRGLDWRDHLNAMRRLLVGTPPNVDMIDAAIGYAINDCEAAIDAALTDPDPVT